MALYNSSLAASSSSADVMSALPRRSPLAELPIANFPSRPPSPVKMHSSPSKLTLSASSSSKSISSSNGSTSTQGSRRASKTSKSPSPRSPRNRCGLTASASMPSPTRASSFMLAGEASSVASRGKLLFASCRGDETVVGANSTCDADATLLQQVQASPIRVDDDARTARSERLSGATSPLSDPRQSSVDETSPPAMKRPVPKSLGRKKERVRVGEVAQALLDQDEDLGYLRAGSPSPAMIRTQRMDILQGSTSASVPSPALLQAAPASIGLGISSTEVSQVQGHVASSSWAVLADEPVAHLLERTLPRHHGSIITSSPAAECFSQPSPTPSPSSSTLASPSLLTPSLSSLALLDDDKENRKPDRVMLQAVRKKKGTGGRLSLVADAGEEQCDMLGSRPLTASPLLSSLR